MRIVFPLFVSVCALTCWHAVTLPPDGNNATGRPVARGIEQARRGGCSRSEGRAGHCPSLGDSVRPENVRHIRSALAAASARQKGSPFTGTPPSPPPPTPPHRHSRSASGGAIQPAPPR